jgi:hypothetical protein
MSPVKLNTPQSAQLGRVESARAAPDFSFFSAVCNQNTANATCHGNLCPCYVLLLPLPPPPPPRASHSAACWLWPRGLSAGWCQPRRAAPQNKG